MNSIFSFIAGLLTSALSLLGFVQQHPELPPAQIEQASQIERQVISQATQTLTTQQKKIVETKIPVVEKDPQAPSQIPAIEPPLLSPESTMLGHDLDLSAKLVTWSGALHYYFGLNKKYPTALLELVSSDGTITFEQNHFGYYSEDTLRSALEGVTYTPSPDSQHFVLSVPQQLSKSAHQSYRPKYLVNFDVDVTGVHYGVNCSDDHTYCVTDAYTCDIGFAVCIYVAE